MLKWLKIIAISVIGLLLIAVIIFYKSDLSRAELWEEYALENSQTIDLAGMPVHYRITGSGSPIVLLHGTAASLHTWQGWTRELEKDNTVISVDLPAFGMTGPHPDSDYSIEAYVTFLELFRKAIELDTFVLAGNSLGGLIAWNYAGMFPDQVAKLILIDPAGFPVSKDMPFAFKLANSKILSPGVRYLTPKSLVKQSIEDVYYNDALITDDLVEQYYEMLLREGNRQAFIDRVRGEIAGDTTLLTTLKMPTMILWGEEDNWIPVENAHKFSDAIPNDTLIIFEKMGHVPMEEAPTITVKPVIDFIK